MQFNTLIRPEHLNHRGKLFGGYMLQWVDEYAYITAIKEYPKAVFVTRGMDAVSFSKGVNLGDLLTFEINLCKVGNTTVTYSVNVTATQFPSGEESQVFSTHITMCNIDEQGHKKELPKPSR